MVQRLSSNWFQQTKQNAFILSQNSATCYNFSFIILNSNCRQQLKEKVKHNRRWKLRKIGPAIKHKSQLFQKVMKESIKELVLPMTTGFICGKRNTLTETWSKSSPWLHLLGMVTFSIYLMSYCDSQLIVKKSCLTVIMAITKKSTHMTMPITGNTSSTWWFTL